MYFLNYLGRFLAERFSPWLVHYLTSSTKQIPRLTILACPARIISTPLPPYSQLGWVACFTGWLRGLFDPNVRGDAAAWRGSPPPFWV